MSGVAFEIKKCLFRKETWSLCQGEKQELRKGHEGWMTGQRKLVDCFTRWRVWSLSLFSITSVSNGKKKLTCLIKPDVLLHWYWGFEVKLRVLCWRCFNDSGAKSKTSRKLNVEKLSVYTCRRVTQIHTLCLKRNLTSVALNILSQTKLRYFLFILFIYFIF